MCLWTAERRIPTRRSRRAGRGALREVLATLGIDDGKPTPAEWNTPTKTIAEGTAIGRPVRQREVAAAIVASGGRAVRVSDEDIGKATLELAKVCCASAARARERDAARIVRAVARGLRARASACAFHRPTTIAPR